MPSTRGRGGTSARTNWELLISVGELKPDAKLNPSELAAWTMIANLLLNLDEVINKG